MAVSLEKGQKISLDKTAGSSLTQITMGLGWDVAKTKGFFGFGGGSETIDLDASCLMFDENSQAVDAIWFAQLTSKDGSIRHSGDNRTGAGDGDDEVRMRHNFLRLEMVGIADHYPADLQHPSGTVNPVPDLAISPVNRGQSLRAALRYSPQARKATCPCHSPTA